MRPARSRRRTRCASATTRSCSPSGWASGRPRARRSRRTSRSRNIALDLLGQARLLLRYAGELEGAGRNEDDLAYLRDEREFRNALLVEQPNGDFARHDRAPAPVRRATSSRSTTRCSDRPTRRSRRSPRRRSRRSPTTATTRASGRCGSATAPRSRTAACSAALDRLWPYAGELFAARRARRAARRRGASPPTARAARRRGEHVVGERARRGDARASRHGRTRHRAGGREGSTPSTSATCSPRCSRCTARTRGPVVTRPRRPCRDPGRAPGRRGERAGPGDPGPHDRGPRHPRATSSDDAGAPDVDAHADVLAAAPRSTPIRDDVAAALRDAGFDDVEVVHAARARRGRPTG